ncbi:hypothetical protein CRG98_049045, partial [Punica granatum]
PRYTRERVGEAALRVARLGWKLQAVGTRKAAAAAGRGKTGRHAHSGHGTVRGRARWTPKRRI